MQGRNGDFVVGIDAGGTSVRVAVADARTGAVVAEARGTASADGGPEPVPSLVTEALQRVRIAPADVSGVCAGITKITRTGVRERWQATLRGVLPNLPEAACRIVPDYVIAFHGAIPDGIGIVAVAGTGSVFYGEDARGGAVRVGGRGWEYGDEGSGAWLTTEMVRRTLRALDHLEKPTPLTEAVCSLLGSQDPATLGEAARQRSEAEGRGFLTPLALERAYTGDVEAANLFVGAAGWIAAYCRAAKTQLAFPDGEPVTVATVGGMWEAGELLLAPFREVLPRFILHVSILPPESPPVIGAVRLAVRDSVDALPSR